MDINTGNTPLNQSVIEAGLEGDFGALKQMHNTVLRRPGELPFGERFAQAIQDNNIYARWIATIAYTFQGYISKDKSILDMGIMHFERVIAEASKETDKASPLRKLRNRAVTHYAEIYERNLLPEGKEEKVIELLRAEKIMGSVSAAFRLAQILEKQGREEEAFEYYLYVLEAGCKQDQKDEILKTAEKAFERAEELKTSKKFDESFVYYKFAADCGILDAIATVGIMYYRGVGIKQDIDAGIGYLTWAADNDHKEAAYALGAHYLKPDHFNLDQALYYFIEAGDLGDIDACKVLTKMYSSNEVMEPDMEAAAYWARQAIRLENGDKNIFAGSMPAAAPAA